MGISSILIGYPYLKSNPTHAYMLNFLWFGNVKTKSDSSLQNFTNKKMVTFPQKKKDDMHVVRCLLPHYITSLFKDKPRFLSLKCKIPSLKKKFKKNFNYKHSLIKELTEINIII